MTPYPVKYETLDPVPGRQMYSTQSTGHCPLPQHLYYTTPWATPQSPPPHYSIPFYSPPLPHFNSAKLVR